MKTINIIIGSLLMLLAFTTCDPLDKENLAAITSEDVWGNPNVAEAYVNDFHADLMPADFNTPRYTDESFDVNGDYAGMHAFLRGTATVDTWNDFRYDIIRRINIFLDGIDEATFDEASKNRLKGEALFWRSWVYFRMVRAYGGVELVLEPGDATDIETSFIPRSSTSECFTQILKDVDEAIALLPDVQANARIDKCAAISFKGRVLLFWASPQFNRNNDQARWQQAYDANKAAVEFLDSKGKGLYDKYKDLWHDEMNKEVIMVRRYQYPTASNGYSQACMRPLLYARGCVGSNYPTWELVKAYPMADGSKYDPATTDIRKFFMNRDPRFYHSVAYNGSEPYISPMFGNECMWTYWYDSDGDPNTGTNGREARADNDSPFGQWAENLFSHGSFYPVKLTDRTITRTTVQDGSVDWIEIRYAEVLMNYGECANETGKTAEALDVLYKIRERAGITGGIPYGITASAKDDLRQAFMDERRVEFAFEAKRFWDLRRWRIFAQTFNNLEDKYLHGLRIEWLGTAADRPGGLTDINTLWDQFDISEVKGYVQTAVYDEDKYSFFGIPTSILERNSKLEQNNTWGGTFDPLK